MQLLQFFRSSKQTPVRFTDRFGAGSSSAANEDAAYKIFSDSKQTDGTQLGSFACRILIVAAYPRTSEAFADELLKLGHEVNYCDSEPRELVRRFGTGSPSVVVIETSAGVSGFLDGCILVGCIRAVPFVNQPLIYLVSSIGDGICRREARLAGVDDVLTVPATCAQFSTLIRRSILGPRAQVSAGILLPGTVPHSGVSESSAPF